MRSKFWTEEKIKYLIENYPTGSTKELVENLGISYVKIQQKAKRIPIGKFKKKLSNIEILLDGSNISFYWLGFLLGDGNFSKNYCISVSQKTESKFHVEKYCDYIGVDKSKIKNYSGKLCTVRIKNKFVCTEIMKLLGIGNRKTYEPPENKYFENLTRDQFVSLIIGFIDADGHIMKNNKGIRIRKHINWEKTFEYLNYKIYSLFSYEVVEKKFNCVSPSGFLNTKKYLFSFWHISGIKILKDLKNFSINNDLPVFERKWKNIQLDIITDKEKNEIINLQIIEMFKNIKDHKQIAEYLNITKKSVYDRIRKLKLI